MTAALSPKNILLLHPGAMGHVVGGCLTSTGHRVTWISEGRSQATVARAKASGLEDRSSLSAGLADAAFVLSICPPDAAMDVAAEVAAAGFGGIYIDANAISPTTARRIETTVSRAGATMIDGGIVGPPPTAPGRTRLFLSGADAESAAALFEKSALEAIPIGSDVGGASALKMAYAAWTKGTSALFLGIRALARAEGVETPLIEEWQRSQPALAGPKAEAARHSIAKAWRFSGEMREIADAFAAQNLPNGFHMAAADIFDTLGEFKDVSNADLDQAVARLLR